MMCNKEGEYINEVMMMICLNGKCDDIGKCICNAGYSNDVFLLRLRDCNLNKAYMVIIFSVLLLISFFSFFLSIFTIFFVTIKHNNHGYSNINNNNNKQVRAVDAANDGEDNDVVNDNQNDHTSPQENHMVKQKESVTRKVQLTSIILVCCIAINVSLIALSLHQYHYEYKFNASAMFILTVISIALYVSVYLIFYSLFLPLFRLSGTPESSFRYFLVISCTLFRLCNIISFIILAATYGDAIKQEDDHNWNVHVCINLLLYFVEDTILCLAVTAIYYKMMFLFKALDPPSSSSMSATATSNTTMITIPYPNILNSDFTTEETLSYLKRIQLFSRLIYISIPVLSLCNLLIPGLYTFAGYAPFTYLIFSLTLMTIPMFTIVVARFVQKEHGNLLSIHSSLAITGRRSKQVECAVHEIGAMNRDPNNNNNDNLHRNNSIFSKNNNRNEDDCKNNKDSYQQFQSKEKKSNKARNAPTSYLFSEMTTVNSIVAIESSEDPQLFASNQGWKTKNGWIEIMQNDGLIVYYHPETRTSSFDPPPGF